MSRNGSGTYSLPAGNPVVAGTTISPTTHNNTMSDIAAELTNSVAKDGQSTLTGPLKASDGSVSAPGVTFGADTNSGFYRPGSDSVALALGGANVDTAAATLRTIATNVKLSGANPASTTAFSSTVTPLNIVKGWAVVVLNGSATPSIQTGFSVTSAAASASEVTVTFAQSFANTTPHFQITTGMGSSHKPVVARITSRTATTVVFELYEFTIATPSDCSLINPSTNGDGHVLYVTALGAQ